MDQPLVFGIVVALGITVNAQTINVHGEVMNAANQPIANAVVELLHAPPKDTTGTDGLYSLTAGANAVQPSSGAMSADIRLDGSVLDLTVTKAEPIRIEIFGLKGNLLDKAAWNVAAAGSYRWNVTERIQAKNLLLIKASVGEKTKIFPYFSMPGGMANTSLEYTTPASGPLAKAAAFVDSLQATAAGYQTKWIGINAYDQTQDITLTSCTPPTPPAAKDAVTLDMAVTGGAPTYLASGFIYGLSEDGTQPPTSLLTDIKVKGLRAGRGVVEGCGAQSWITHFGVMKAYYARAKAIGATLLLLVSDDYGYSCPIPGNGGDWTGFTTFMSQLIDSAKANGMTGPDVRWELWNEPDLNIFWTGTQAQWLATWTHAYQQVRAAIPGAIIEGPSLATGPGGAWMNAFLDYAQTNNVIPDYFTWHEEGGGADPVADLATITQGLASRGITEFKGFDVNEYGTQAEQNPGHSAWFLARFDRTGMQGLRGNWANGTEFFSNLGDLVASNWQPNSQYWIYQRYADQTGLRINTTAGSQVDAVAYADASAAKAIIVVGNKGGVTGSVNVVIKHIPSWLQGAGATKVLIERMPAGDGALSAPVVDSSAAVLIACNTVIVTLNWANASDGYVLTLSPH